MVARRHWSHMHPGTWPAEGTSSLACGILTAAGSSKQALSWEQRTSGPTTPFTPPSGLPNEPTDLITSLKAGAAAALLSQTKNVMTPGGAASLVTSSGRWRVLPLWEMACPPKGFRVPVFPSPGVLVLSHLVTRYGELFALKFLPVEVAFPPPQPWSPTEGEPIFHRLKTESPVLRKSGHCSQTSLEPLPCLVFFSFWADKNRGAIKVQ